MHSIRHSSSCIHAFDSTRVCLVVTPECVVFWLVFYSWSQSLLEISRVWKPHGWSHWGLTRLGFQAPLLPCRADEAAGRGGLGSTPPGQLGRAQLTCEVASTSAGLSIIYHSPKKSSKSKRMETATIEKHHPNSIPPQRITTIAIESLCISPLPSFVVYLPTVLRHLPLRLLFGRWQLQESFRRFAAQQRKDTLVGMRLCAVHPQGLNQPHADGG